jgi:hypothetical protein
MKLEHIGKIKSEQILNLKGLKLDFEKNKWINIIGDIDPYNLFLEETKIIDNGIYIRKVDDLSLSYSSSPRDYKKYFKEVIKKYNKLYNISTIYRNDIFFRGIMWGVLWYVLNGDYNGTAVVLIEDLGSRYKNSLNRYIPRILQETFPNVQFIVTTDNPVILQNSGIDAITYKIKRYKSDIEAKRVNYIVSMDCNDILSSFLDVESPYSIEIEEINEKKNQIAYGNTVEPLTDKEIEILRMARKSGFQNPELEAEILKFLKERDKI